MKRIINRLKKIWYVFIIALVIGFITLFVVLHNNSNDIYKNNKDNIDSKTALYLRNLRKKDKKIYNKTKVKLIEGEFKGIDVSSWQGDIDFEKLSQTGIDYIMIRCAFRSVETDEIKLDSKFVYNITEAMKYEIPVGVYFYSTAINKIEALEEASYVINLIDNYEIEMPIVYDFEIFNQYRAKETYAKQINENALAFLDYVEEHGYEGMLYTNLHSLEHYWDYDNFNDYNIWFAQYMDDKNYSKDYFMWQYSSNGRIDGIVGNVDLNESYYMFVKD